MRIINANTKISTLIKANPNVIDALIKLNPVFKILKNPITRTIFASMMSIKTAAKIGKCSLEDTFDVLKPFGFIIDYGAN